MREIKFRGISVVSNKFVYGSLISLGNGYVIAKSSDIVGTTSSDDVFLSYSNDEVDIVFPDTIGQFTGLCDKNGKEIYEGDIVIYIDDEGDKNIGFVKYIDDYAMYLFVSPDCWDEELRYCDMIEVIGNIHDNKELLEE